MGETRGFVNKCIQKGLKLMCDYLRRKNIVKYKGECLSLWGGFMQKLNRIDLITLKILKIENRELTVQEIADKAGITPDKIHVSLQKIFKYCT